MSVPKYWNDIAKLLELEGGWNSYGAARIDHRCAGRMAVILAFLLDTQSPQPSLVPCSDGGLQAEWHGDHEIEISVSPFEKTEIWLNGKESASLTEVQAALLRWQLSGAIA